MTGKPMTKLEMVEAIAKQANINKTQAKAALESLVAMIKEQVGEGNEFHLAGLGTFGRRERKARTGRNPASGEAITIPSRRTMGFRQSKTIKTLLNAGE